MPLKTLGLIAGMGELPRTLALEARKMGYRVIVIALRPLVDKSLKEYADEFCEVSVGHLGGLIKSLKRFELRDIVMAGKVPKSLLYNKGNIYTPKSRRLFGDLITPDLRALRLLFSLKDRSDDSIMLGITRELEKEGIRLLKTTTFLKELLTPEGVLTKRKPEEGQWKDIKFGLRIAKEIGRLDIGQTVVVKDLSVMAVEAIEGTDEAILRGGTLAEDGAVVIKVSKPQQDMRFDVPAVGIDTLHVMKKVHACVLALEAQRSIIIDKERFTEEADDLDIAVVGISGDKF